MICTYDLCNEPIKSYSTGNLGISWNSAFLQKKSDLGISKNDESENEKRRSYPHQCKVSPSLNLHFNHG